MGFPRRPIGPIYLTGTYTTNLLRGGDNNSGLVTDRIKYIHICNTDGSAHTFRIFLSTTGDNTGGKELYKDISIPANSYWSDFCDLVLKDADFLVGGADTGSNLVITFYSENELVVTA